MIPTLTLVENQDGVESSDVSQHIAAYPPYYHQQQQASQPHVHREYAAAPSAPHHHTTHHMDSYYRASVGAAPHGEGPSIHPYDGCSGGWGNDQHQSHIPRRSHFSQAVMHPYGGGHIRIQQKSVPVFRHQREEEQEQEVLPLDEGS